MRVTVNDIIFRLGVTALQIENAIYSGALPKPISEGHHLFWDAETVEFHLDAWEQRIGRKKPRDSNRYISTGGLTIPRHQR